jgi:Peptidase family M49
MRSVKRILPLTLILGTMLTATAAIPDLAQLQKMIARFKPTELRVDTSQLSPGDRQALAKLIEASRLLNDIFLTQMWSGNHALYAKLQRDTAPLGRGGTPLNRARLDYFWLNKSPWSEIDNHEAFLPDVPPKKVPGANFYPEDMTREEFEAWVKTLSKPEREQAEGFFTVIRRDANHKLHAVPYSQEYRADLEKSAKLLEEAAALTDNATLKTFLSERAAAFRSNNYYESDIAWMDLDAPIDITIGPYETYNDDIFGYKAAFEAYVNVRDEAETAKLKFFADHLQEVENNLPIDPKYRNPKLGASSPIRVVNEIFDAGDAAHAVQTAAYNLPNDERVVTLKGSKRVMLKNVQEAKFHSTLEPIAKRVLTPASQKDLSFDSFFTHILAHELSHGIGPHQITVAGRATSPRQELKELYSAIEEAKADVTGLFMLQHLYDRKLIPSTPATERQLYTTFLASTFRTLRFGLNDAHGKGMALQVNYITDKGGFIAHPDGTFEVNFEKIRPAVRDLDHDLLTIEATGDYAGAKKMLDELGVIRPNMQKALNGLAAIPVDIQPVFVTANQIVPEHARGGN